MINGVHALLQRLELRHLTAANLLRESVFASISSALDSQIAALQRQSYQREHGGDLFEPSYPVMAARRATVESLPVTQVTKETVGQQTTCPICLHVSTLGPLSISPLSVTPSVRKYLS